MSHSVVLCVLFVCVCMCVVRWGVVWCYVAKSSDELCYDVFSYNPPN